MGIKGLMPFISDHAPLAVKETEMKALTGRTIAIDASMSLYQFIVAVRQGDSQVNLTNDAGEVTSHIQGFLSRTVKMMELGIKPVYVFDGKAPDLKSVELAAREEKKQQAELELKAALESGDAEEIRKASHRSVRVTQQMNADVQELLRLLGCPVVLAPCEAEASCAALCQAGRVYATATEDMDALTFGSPVMLKNLFDTESSRTQTKRPVFELHLARLLEQLDVSREAFVDFCILCGCDYTGTIRGVGPMSAFKLLKQHGSIEAVAATLDSSKLPPAESWQVGAARALFMQPEVVEAASVELRWRAPDVPGLRAFLVQRHSFNEARVDKVIERLNKCSTSGKQTRLESFFASKGPRPVAAESKFDPFAKKASSSGTAKGGKRPAAAGGGSKAKKKK